MEQGTPIKEAPESPDDQEGSAIKTVGGAAMAAQYSALPPLQQAQIDRNKRMDESPNLTYAIMTKENLDNKLTHDECLVQIFAAPDFLPCLKKIKAKQMDSMQYNQMRQTMKNSKKKVSLFTIM